MATRKRALKPPVLDFVLENSETAVRRNEKAYRRERMIRLHLLAALTEARRLCGFMTKQKVEKACQLMDIALARAENFPNHLPCAKCGRYMRRVANPYCVRCHEVLKKKGDFKPSGPPPMSRVALPPTTKPVFGRKWDPFAPEYRTKQ